MIPGVPRDESWGDENGYGRTIKSKTNSQRLKQEGPVHESDRPRGLTEKKESK